MTPETASNALIGLAGLGALLVLWFKLIPDLRMDILRQDLFELRDDLFDHARAGRIAFDHEAYGRLRTLLNGHIRFAHRYDVAMFMLFFLVTLGSSEELKRSADEDERRWSQALRRLSPDTRAMLQEIRDRSHARVSRYVAHSILWSPLGILLVFLGGIGVLVWALAVWVGRLGRQPRRLTPIARVQRRFRFVEQQIDAAAIEGGRMHDPAGPALA